MRFLTHVFLQYMLSTALIVDAKNIHTHTYTYAHTHTFLTPVCEQYMLSKALIDDAKIIHTHTHIHICTHTHFLHLHVSSTCFPRHFSTTPRTHIHTHTHTHTHTFLTPVCEQYMLSKALIDDAKNNLMLTGGSKSINIKCPVRLLQVCTCMHERINECIHQHQH
jgi:hypothetical protein